MITFVTKAFKNMNSRLKQFLSVENISQSSFADTIGVAKASISHILAGRNKPGFDFIESVARHYPTLNIDWLVTGRGKMYGGGVSSSSRLFDDADELAKDLQESNIAQATDSSRQFFNSRINSQSLAPLPTRTDKKITKIMVFYDDNSYVELP